MNAFVSKDHHYIEYHRNKNPKLKTSLITLLIVVSLIGGIFIAETIAYSLTFPKSAKTIKIEGVNFWLGTSIIKDTQNYVSGFGSGKELRIKLGIYCDLDDSLFPSDINASHFWLLPSVGRLWPWRNYMRESFVNYSYSYSTGSLSFDIFETDWTYQSSDWSNFEYLYESDKIDIIVSLNGIDNQSFYVHERNINVIESTVW